MILMNDRIRMLRPAPYQFSNKESAEYFRWFAEDGVSRTRPLDEDELVKFLVAECDATIKEARRRVREESLAKKGDKQLWLLCGANLLVDRIISAMLAEIEKHGLELMQHYPNDLLIHDKNVLMLQAVAGASIAWTVSDTATHLAPLGLHPESNQHVGYCLNLSSRQRFYHLSINQQSFSLKEISREEYKLLEKTSVPYGLGKKPVEGVNRLYKGDRVVGDINLVDIGNWHQRCFEVTVVPAEGISNIDMNALAVWAARIPVDIAGTLFVRTKEIWKDAVGERLRIAA